MRMRPRRFQAGGVNDPTWTPTAGGSPMPGDGTMTTGGTSGTTPAAGGSQQPSSTTTTAPASTAPSSTSNAPASSDPTGGAYFSWTPAQQQAYGNGVPVDQVNAMTPAATTTPTATAGSNYVYNPYASPGQNPTPPAGFVALPFGTGASVVNSPASMAAQTLAYQNSPFMTPAALANQAKVGAAGDPMSGQNVTIGGQQVPWNSMTELQKTMYEYFLGTGQSVPSDLMTTYQGPNTAANQSYGGWGVGQSAPGNLTVAAAPTRGATTGGGTGGIANPGAFTSSAPAAGVGTGMGAAGTPAAPQTATAQTTGTGNFMGQGAGLGYRKGGAMRTRPKRFQMGGFNPAAGGGLNPQVQQIMAMLGQGGGAAPGAAQTTAAQGAMAGGLPGGPGAAGMGAAAGAANPLLGPAGSPGAMNAMRGAIAGAAPGTPGAAAMGAAAGAGQGTPNQGPGGMPPGGPPSPQMLQALQAGMAGGPGMAGPGIGGAQSPNQQWGQLMLGGAPGTGINQQTLANNPTAQQALYRAYLSQLGAGGFGGAGVPARGGMAEGGEVRHTSIGHLSPAHQDSAAYRYPIDVANDHTPGSHPDRQWGLVAESPGRYAHGGEASDDARPPKITSASPTSPTGFTAGSHGAASKFDSTKGAPNNLPTHAGGKKLARGGRATFASAEHEKAPVKKGAVRSSVALRRPRPAAPPPPPYHDTDPLMAPADAPQAMGGPPVATPAPSVPPPPGAPFAKGGVCKVCGKAHGGSCKGMRGGGRFHGAKAKTVKLADGGKWIQGAIKKPGALHEQLGVPQGEKIPAKKLAKAAKASGKLGQRARLAQTLKGLGKAAGGPAEAVPVKRGAVRGEQKMAAGGAAKERKDYPKTIAPPKKMRFANGGKIRGCGVATKGCKFSGIY